MDTILKIRAQDLDHALVDNLKQQFGNARMEIRVYDIPETAGILSELDFWGSLLNWIGTSKTGVESLNL